MVEKDKRGGEDDRTSAQALPRDDHGVKKRDDTAVYTVYPKKFEDKDQAAAIDTLLKDLVEDQSEIRTTKMDGHTVFWTAPLTSNAAQRVEQDPNVGSAPRECLDDCHDQHEASVDVRRPPEHTDHLVKRDDRAGYIVYQKDNADFGQAAAIHKLLKTLVSNESEVYVSDTSQRTLFFGVPLTTEAAKKVKADPNVAAVVERRTSSDLDPTGGIDSDIATEQQLPDTTHRVRRNEELRHIVYLKDFRNKQQAADVHTLLKSLVAENDIYVSDTDTVTYFLAAPMTGDIARKVGEDPNVSGVVKPCKTNCYDPFEEASPRITEVAQPFSNKHTNRTTSHLVKRDDGEVNSHKAADEMVYISLPIGGDVDDYDDFVYDKSAGTGITVYILDSGASFKNDEEFAEYVKPNSRWIHPQGVVPTEELKNDSWGIGHGTGTLAKVAGRLHGVAKRASPVIVRLARAGDPAAFLDGLRRVRSDWYTTYRQDPGRATAVINISLGFTLEGLALNKMNEAQQQQWIEELREATNDLIAVGILPIAASGNGIPDEDKKGKKVNKKVNQYPQLLAYSISPDVPHMMVTGGCGTDGTLWERSRVDLDENLPVIKVHAPAYHITVPDAMTGDWRHPETVQGVSYATPSISGLAAYFLGLSSLSGVLGDDHPVERVKNLKRFLETNAIERTTNVKSLYNLQNPRTCPPDVPPDFNDGDEVECAATSSYNGDNVVDIPNCFITTLEPASIMGLTTPSPICSCAGGTMAGVGVGTVDGTTYSWCQTGGDLPPGVPTEAKPQHAAPKETPPTTLATSSQEFRVNFSGTARPAPAPTEPPDL